VERTEVNGQFGIYHGTEGKLADLKLGCSISSETWERSTEWVQQQQQQQQHYSHHHDGNLIAKDTKAYACKQHQRRFSSVCL
jgi:hypothetical protein